MTQTSASVRSGAPAWVPLSRTRRALRAIAIASCLPYLSLKVAWIAGSRAGIPEGSSLLEHRGTMAVANSVTVVMDGAVIVLALLLTRPWGRRVPAWLLVGPTWVASGLLAPIVAGFPLQLLVTAFGGSGDVRTEREPFLDAWVFGVVYTGFIVQGLALGALFVLYARDRWGHVWRTWPDGPGRRAPRVLAVASAVVALFPAGMHLAWTCGATAGLSEGRISDRTGDFHLLEALYFGFLAAAVTGAWLLAFRRGRVLSVKVPLALAWIGSGAMACWGVWLSLVSLTGVDDITEQPTVLMNLTYAGQMVVGMLVVSVGVHFLAGRSGAARRPA
ncbi:hypothetical protein [Streptomyces ureilyticus]|uniref:Aromatic ring-opening dioxygenase LigA n=1 Tax=Streptomyces ureilyticus TaxID=1775131 RepID=A0ABX0DQI4_9ACTN|nr:hypothetical protein [Streptomyces ureilyticus]NGO42729.1 hypothetical protein [Streptomyces ureilyticus]